MFSVSGQTPENGHYSRKMMALNRITDTLVPRKKQKQANKLSSGVSKSSIEGPSQL